MDKIKVKLKVPKTIYGIDYKVGDTVPVRPDIALRWERAGISECADGTTLDKSDKESHQEAENEAEEFDHEDE